MKRFLFLAVFFMVMTNAYSSDIVSIVRIIDGDTVVVFDGEYKEKVRLIGIDAPESKRNDKAIREAERIGIDVNDVVRAGRQAKNFAEAISPIGTIVSLEYSGELRDQYGRLLAYIRLANGRVLNEVLLSAGAAKATTQYKHKDIDKYQELQEKAIIGRRGLWDSIWRVR